MYVGATGMGVVSKDGLGTEGVEELGATTPDRGESSVSLPSVSVLVTSSAGAAEPVNIFAKSSISWSSQHNPLRRVKENEQTTLKKVHSGPIATNIKVVV